MQTGSVAGLCVNRGWGNSTGVVMESVLTFVNVIGIKHLLLLIFTDL